MIEIDITSIPETTVTVSANEVTKVINVLSFQNVSRGILHWSTSELNDTNTGALVLSTDERVFSVPQTLYLLGTDRKSLASVHVRSIAL